MEIIKLTVGLLSLLALFFIYQIWPFKNTPRTGPQPPEPAGAWPIVGHLGLLSATTPLHRTLAALSDQYGGIFALRLGQKRALVVSSPELVRECLTTNDRALADRPALQSYNILGYNRAMFCLSPYGTWWREVRKIALVDRLSSRRLELLKHIRLEEISSLVRGLYRTCRDDEPVEMKQQLRCLTMNIIIRMVAGRRYFDGGEAIKDEQAMAFGESIEEFFHLLGVFTLSDAFPWLKWLDVGGHLKAMKRVHLKIDKFVTTWLAEHRQRRDSGVASGSDDFIDVLISQLDDGHFSGVHDTDTQIKATAMSLISAATDTTSDSLVWALSLLLNNRHVLKKAQDELDFHVGTKRQVDESDVEKLTYLHAIFKETTRLHPAAPLLVPHESMEPISVGGYHIPKGVTLFFNAWKMQRDPAVWSEPEEFEPERFLTSHGEAKFGSQNFELIPFGSGRRSCVGSLLATQVAHLTLARLIHSFEWSTPEDDPVDMTEGFGLTMPKATPLHVLLRPRLPPHLYE